MPSQSSGNPLDSWLNVTLLDIYNQIVFSSSSEYITNLINNFFSSFLAIDFINPETNSSYIHSFDYFYSIQEELKFQEGKFIFDLEFFKLLGSISLNTLSLFGNYSSSTKIYLSTKAIPLFYNESRINSSTSETNLNGQYAYQFLVQFRKCELGEIYKSETKAFTNIKILNLFFIFFNYIFEKVALNVLKTNIL